MKTIRRTTLALLVGAWALQALPASAQGEAASPTVCPSKTVRFIVPFPAGAATDVLARLIGNDFNKNMSLGANVIVENKPGASGTLGNNFVAHSKPDGCTVLFGIGAMMTAPVLYPKLPYDTLRDFIPITRITDIPNALVVPSSSSIKSFQELLDVVKASPGKFTYGQYGNGSFSHIQGELLKRDAKLDITAVSYNGASPLITSVMGGQVPIAIVDVPNALQTDRIRILAVTGGKRHSLLPEVKTLAEYGFPNFTENGWIGVFLPKGTPQFVVDKLAVEMRRAIRLPEFAAHMKTMGLVPIANTPQEFGAQMAADVPRVERLMKELQISAN